MTVTFIPLSPGDDGSPLLPVRRDWEAYALCAQVDTELFFPEKGGSTKEAKRVCKSCEVRQDCLNAALNRREKHGIWGDTSERERRAMLRELDRRKRGDRREDAA